MNLFHKIPEWFIKMIFGLSYILGVLGWWKAFELMGLFLSILTGVGNDHQDLVRGV